MLENRGYEVKAEDNGNDALLALGEALDFLKKRFNLNVLVAGNEEALKMKRRMEAHSYFDKRIRV